MLRRGIRLVVSAVLMIAAADAFAACSAPSQSGLALCFPSVGSTVMYPATIEMAVNSGGVPITAVSVYDGNTLVDNMNFLPAELIDEGRLNGFHRITVNAWDATGKLYQAETSFTIIGFGLGPCAQGSGPVTLCTPAQGSYEPSGTVLISAYFAALKSWSMTLDGQPFADSSQPGLSASGPLEFDSGVATAGAHTLVVSAVDSTGATSTITRNFSAFYELNCGPKSGTCSPGIEIVQPADISTGSAGDEGTSFPLQAEVMYNPKPATKMIAYMDGVELEQSAGPGISVNVHATKGSHYIVILAWDTTGDMYETYGNVDVQ
jgi:hypothetical protein